MKKNDKPIDFPYIGLALPGQPGSWQGECKVLCVIICKNKLKNNNNNKIII